ncbi:MAG: hypothetical protein FWG67_01990 [Defluviitaleaceae bacterium]|nr:hypothetical protein [Defluviitaleaceae bacterium]
MRKQNSDFKTSFLSEVGTQLENRDYHGFVELDDFACWVVADGIDECEHKKSAVLAVQAVLAAFTKKPGMSKRHLHHYLTTAHRFLRHESTKVRLKASVMVVVTDYVKLRYAHAGNVRLQMISEDLLRLESDDHSYYQQKLADGTYPVDRSVGFEERNNLINYVGIPKGFRLKASKKYKLAEMETILITTVGFWEQVRTIEVIDGLAETKDPKEATDNLEDQLLSKQAQKLNNYTIAAIFVNKLFLKEKKWWPIIKRVLLILIPILMILGIWLFMRHRQNRIQRELTAQLVVYKLAGDDYIIHGSFARALEQYSAAVALLPSIRQFDEAELLRLKHRLNQLIVDGYASVEREDFERARDYFIRARHYLIEHGATLPIFESGHLIAQIDYIGTRLYVDELLTLGDLQVGLGQYSRALETYRMARTVVIGLNNLNLMQRLNISIDTAQALYDDANESLARAAAAEATQQAEDTEGLAPEALASLFEGIARIYDDAGLREEAARMRMRAHDIREDAEASDFLEQQQLATELEAQGDAALMVRDYQGALAYYQAAERIYRAINSEFNITLITQKILAVNDLIQAEERQIPAPQTPPVQQPAPTSPPATPPTDPPPTSPPTSATEATRPALQVRDWQALLEEKQLLVQRQERN